jgi:hypothetical protein
MSHSMRLQPLSCSIRFISHGTTGGLGTGSFRNRYRLIEAACLGIIIGVASIEVCTYSRMAKKQDLHEFGGKLDKKFDELGARLDKKFDKLEAKIDSLLVLLTQPSHLQYQELYKNAKEAEYRELRRKIEELN